MSIYIRNMEMPKTESEVLIIAIESDGSVYPVRIDGDGQPMIFQNEEMKNCAIPVQPHRRLGDLDELYAHLNEWYLTNNPVFTKEEALYIRAMLLGIVEAPTVIEASGKDVNSTTKEET